MVRCRRKRKYGGSLVLNKMKDGFGKWGEAGKSGLENMKSAQVRATKEREALAASYKNQKALNAMSSNKMSMGMAVGGRKTKRKRRRRKKTKRRRKTLRKKQRRKRRKSRRRR